MQGSIDIAPESNWPMTLQKSFWTTFLPLCGAQATGLWSHSLSPSAWGLGTQSMDPIAHTQLTLLLPLLHSLEQSGNFNC